MKKQNLVETNYPCIEISLGTQEGLLTCQNILFCITGYEKFFEHLPNCPKCKSSWITALAILWQNPSFVDILSKTSVKIIKRALFHPFLPKGIIPYNQKQFEKKFLNKKFRSYEAEENLRKHIAVFFQ